VNFFNDKLRVIADYYDRFTSDILTRVPLPVLSGLSGVPFQNVASVKNTGVELTVDYSNSAFNQQLTYNIGVNVSFNKNKVTKLNKEAEIVYWDARIAQGRQILDFFGYVHDGIFQSADEIATAPAQPNAAPGDIKFKDLNNDKVINADDRTYIGSNLAKQSLGINGGIAYKGFDLTFSMNGDFGRDRVIDAPGFAITRGAEQTNGMYNGRWTGAGTSNWVPRIVGGDPNGNSRFSTFWLRSQDYLRIQNVQLGYDFSKNVLTATGLRSLRVYAAVQNLATFTDYPGFDPEIWATDYPIPRSFFFGVNIGLN
jgi:TonB-dependent starch-binding outer membrane protein SusC